MSATVCYMETVTHREMRNRSGEILRRVEAGESVQVSNNGHPAALIVPVGGSILDGLIARGDARASRTSLGALSSIRRSIAPVSTAHLLDDMRGRW
jgi:prevent-host-death family protein